MKKVKIQKTIDCYKSISENEIKQAANEDYHKQTKYNDAYDRRKGFVEGAKWVMKRMNVQIQNL